MTAWMERALCADDNPEHWHPVTARADEAAYAKSVCRRCPVKHDCLAHALADHTLHGVWGGTTLDERNALRTGRHRSPLAEMRAWGRRHGFTVKPDGRVPMALVRAWREANTEGEA